MHGFDTESPFGQLKVVGTELEAKEVSTIDDVLRFIGKEKYASSFFFCFNLRYDAEQIIKLLDYKTGLEIYKNRTRKGVEIRKGVFLSYIGSKLMKICTHGHCVTFIDIATFYEGMTLEDASQKFLGKGKNPISAKRIGEEKGYYEKNVTGILEYCRVDCLRTLELAKRMQNIIETCKMPRGKLSFRNPISSAKIVELYVKDNYKFPGIPKGVEKFHLCAQESYHGGMFQTFKRGMFNKKLYSYDINSAYPAVMQNLPHWGNGRFDVVKKPGKGEYGWYAVRFDCEWIPFDDFSSPYSEEFCFSDLEHCSTKMLNKKTVMYPKGIREQWVTKIEYEWMLKHGFYCEFVTGIEWVRESNKYESPFVWIPDVYKRRKEIQKTGDESQYALKIVLNGMYGKLAQSRHGFGQLSNFFYASYITAATRLMVAEVAIKYPENIIEIATDSTLLDCMVELPISEKLGEWSLKVYERGLLIGSGMRQVWDDKGFETHARGITYKRDWNMKEALETCMDKEYYRFIGKDSEGKDKKRPIHLGEVLMHTKVLKWKDLGVFMSVSKKLNVNTDKKRKWQRNYKNFGDFLESLPINSECLKVTGGKLVRNMEVEEK
jgi:hypothetical protein